MVELENVAVIGACGKMGRGIALLLLQEMTVLAIKTGKFFHLKLIDVNEEGYGELKSYLRTQILRFAEKNINYLREIFACDIKKVSNQQIIDGFVIRAMELFDCSPNFNFADLVFEAVFEDVPLKIGVLSQIHQKAPQAYVLTNTSCIPIKELAVASGLKQRLIGFHFYNPPAVQKLLEIIPSEITSKELRELALELAKQLKKTVVISADVAGFIGNGHFAEEIVYACGLVESLTPQYTVEEAIQIVDHITRDQLLRPMGIFELLDYVGLPVIEQILKIMKGKPPALIEQWRISGLAGGQTLEGQSKNGIYRYKDGKPDAIWSFCGQEYVPLMPKSESKITWKIAGKTPEVLKGYFEGLVEEDKLAALFLKESARIVKKLVQDKVAASQEDVGAVLKNGFFHLYSPHEVIK